MRLSSLGCLLREVRCFGHIQLRVGPRADSGCWRDYIAWLAWELLGVPPSWRRRMGRVRLECVCIDLDMDKWQEMDGWMVFVSNNGKVCCWCWTYGELSPANRLPLSSLKLTSKFQIIVQLAAISRHGFNPIYHYVGLPTSFFSESKKKNYSTAPAHHKMANTQITEEPAISLSSC